MQTPSWNPWRRRTARPERPEDVPRPVAGRCARPSCRAQRLRDRAEVAEDLTEWRELMAEAERLACPSHGPGDEPRRGER